MSNYYIVVPWHNQKQRNDFLEAWGAASARFDTLMSNQRLIMVQDTDKSGCALTKNRGINQALEMGADYVIVLDDDCYPSPTSKTIISLADLAEAHIKCLQPVEVRMVVPTTHPINPRGMPYRKTRTTLPVAASMGFWNVNPDFDAITSLVHGPEAAVGYLQTTVYGRYFPFSGMNYAFHKSWADCARHVNVPRFDDIWMGWVWQKVAYARGACFNLNGPVVDHVRQSDVWANFDEEAKYLQINETLWESIHLFPSTYPDELYEKFFESATDAPAATA